MSDGAQILAQPGLLDRTSGNHPAKIGAQRQLDDGSERRALDAAVVLRLSSIVRKSRLSPTSEPPVPMKSFATASAS